MQHLGKPRAALRRPAAVVQRARRSPDWLHTARWQRLRLRILDRDHWVCQETGVDLVEGRTEPNAAVVDHIVPHRGDPVLFWDESNLRSVAKAWHDTVKQATERGGHG